MTYEERPKSHREHMLFTVDAVEDPRQCLPEFVRLPKAGGRCQLTGLSRATLNELILGDKPVVKSVVLRKRGHLRGIRLIVTESLLGYLHALEVQGNL